VADFEASAEALRNRLIAGFTDLPIYWPNDPRDPADNPAAKGGWVLSEIRLLDEGPASMGADGNRLHRDDGELAIYVNVPVGSKTGTAEKHAAAIRALFKIKAVAGVTITRRVIGSGERIDGVGRWWSVPLIIEWNAYRVE
jgi:hypothetical protein